MVIPASSGGRSMNSVTRVESLVVEYVLSVHKALGPIPWVPVMMLLSRQVVYTTSPFAWPSQSYLLFINAPLAKPSLPEVSSPAARSIPGQTVNFTCKSQGFSPRNITLKWFKKSEELPHLKTTVNSDVKNVSYNIISTVMVKLDPKDVHSQVICEVSHITLDGGSLRGTANLSGIIRGRCPWLLAQAHSSHYPTTSTVLVVAFQQQL